MTEDPTCTTPGQRYQVCKRDGCNQKNFDEAYAAEHPALDHDFEGAEWVIEAPTCTTPGQRYQVCKRDGCNQKNIDEAYAEAHPALGHVWGKYVDDDKPGAGSRLLVRNQVLQGWYPNIGSMATGVTIS